MSRSEQALQCDKVILNPERVIPPTSMYTSKTGGQTMPSKRDTYP